MGHYRVNRKMRKYKKALATGRVVGKKVHQVGDIVEWPDDDAARFVRSGTFSPVDEDGQVEPDEGDRSVVVEPEDATSDEGSPEAPSSQPSEGADTDDEPQGTPALGSDEVEVRPADYNEWEYKALQAEAKAFGIPANQSREDLIADLEGLGDAATVTPSE